MIKQGETVDIPSRTGVLALFRLPFSQPRTIPDGPKIPEEPLKELLRVSGSLPSCEQRLG